jgi:hypothetical protein
MPSYKSFNIFFLDYNEVENAVVGLETIILLDNNDV